MKIAINVCYGGFGVTEAVFKKLGLKWDGGYGYLENSHFGIDDKQNCDVYRSHPDLIKAIEEIGVEQASGMYAKLQICDVPDDIEWYIDDYDGYETIHEKHRKWGE